MKVIKISRGQNHSERLIDRHNEQRDYCLKLHVWYLNNTIRAIGDIQKMMTSEDGVDGEEGGGVYKE